MVVVIFEQATGSQALYVRIICCTKYKEAVRIQTRQNRHVLLASGHLTRGPKQ